MNRFDVALRGEDGRLLERLDGIALRRTGAAKADGPVVAGRNPSVAFVSGGGD